MGKGLENVINGTKKIVNNIKQSVKGLAYSAIIGAVALGASDRIEQVKAQPLEYNPISQSTAQGTTTPALTSELKADLNGDYVVDFKDLAMLADQWLATEGNRKVIPVYDCQELSEPIV